MNKKIISVALAAVMMCSTAAIAASAAEVEEETTGASVTLERSGDAGKVKFNMGDTWSHDDTILFYMWAEKEGETNVGCTKGEWGGEPVWGTKKNKCTPVEGEDGVVESYEFEFYPDPSWNVYVIFHDLTTGAQTCNCILTENGMGKTAVLTGDSFENSVDSDKRDLDVVFDGADDCGAHKLITSTGNIVGHALAPNDDGTYIVAKYVFDRIGIKDKNGEECVTEDKVVAACNEFGTNADSVWEKFQTFKDQDGYADKEANAKKMINPSAAQEEEKKETDSEKKDDSNGTSGSTTTTTTTTTSGTKTTTTTAASTSSTAATTATDTGAATATGDTTGTAAFAAVLFGAAVTMFLARKKVED